MDRDDMAVAKDYIYRNNPDAHFRHVSKTHARYYSSWMVKKDRHGAIHTTVYFMIPLQDIGDLQLTPVVPSTQLVHWLVAK